MANIKHWLVEASDRVDEPIEAIVVGKHYDARWNELAKADENIVLPVEQALAKLDVDFYNGFGGADCFPIYAWTKSWVFFISEYDGATGLAGVPRNPIDCAPEFSGADE